MKKTNFDVFSEGHFSKDLIITLSFAIHLNTHDTVQTKYFYYMNTKFIISHYYHKHTF